MEFITYSIIFIAYIHASPWKRHPLFLTLEGFKGYLFIFIVCHFSGFQYVAPIDEYPIDKWNDMVAVHLTASFHLIRFFLPYMKKKGSLYIDTIETCTKLFRELI